MSFPRGGSGGFGSRRHDHDSSPSPAASGAARRGFGSFGSRRHDCAPSPSPAASEGAARGSDARHRSDHDERGRYIAWKKADFPTDEALRQCKVKRHEDRVISTFSSTSSDSNSDGLRERVCCLLVLNLVSSTLPCIRRPMPRLRVLDVRGFV